MNVNQNQPTMATSSAQLSKKVCLLTGASGTIGYAIAQALKSSSTPSFQWHIILIGRRAPPPSENPSPTLPYDIFLQADITDECSARSTLDSHFETLQSHADPEFQSLNRLDLLINCAGCSFGNEPITDVSVDDFRKVIEVNLISPFILSKWAFTKMASQSQPGGRIINIGSIACESPRLNAG